ncbi:hypothetical protein BCR33DRAFT_787468 [Rhizoclosmatium globosum]|uniref:Uncharacterized protein n=1 Tax=Rhizoclosmatium globosum TaxID=329046 RepID=A0A1Y2C1S7_9FUNG|nr:hypothetical protein BCR33DRAFT_787468 [Rhizoclosmatium globosum]|eukprot:ORY40837.1 hypothetical protein BCR33DRAFT_787468 [Rhizoclosmatium globosum]
MPLSEATAFLYQRFSTMCLLGFAGMTFEILAFLRWRCVDLGDCKPTLANQVPVLAYICFAALSFLGAGLCAMQHWRDVELLVSVLAVRELVHERGDKFDKYMNVKKEEGCVCCVQQLV